MDGISNNIDYSDLLFFNGVARVQDGALYGYINDKHEWIIKPQFIDAEHFIRKTALVKKKTNNTVKISMIDTNGNNILGGWFDEILHIEIPTLVLKKGNEIISFNIDTLQINDLFVLTGSIRDEDPIPVIKKTDYQNKAGYINKKGETIIPFIYEEVSNFAACGYAEVQRFGIKRFINKSGEICILNSFNDIEKKNNKLFYILDKQFEWCGKLESSPDSLFLSQCYRLAVLKDGKWGYYYLTNEYRGNELRVIFPCEYDLPLSDSYYGFVIMKKGAYLCVVNLVDAKYNRSEKTGQYVYGKPGDILFKIEADELYPFISVSGEDVSYGPDCFRYKKYDIIGYIIKRGFNYGIVDTNGIIIKPCVYSDIYIKEKNKPMTHTILNKICIAELNGYKEFIDYKGQQISHIKALDIFQENDLWVIKNELDSNHYFVFDVQKQEIGSIPFDDILYCKMNDDPWRYTPEYYLIKIDNQYGVLNTSGKITLDCIYSHIEFVNMIKEGNEIGGFKVTINEKQGIFDLKGKQILPCIYDTIKPYTVSGGIYFEGFITNIEGMYGCYSYKGDQLVEDCITSEEVAIQKCKEKLVEKYNERMEKEYGNDVHNIDDIDIYLPDYSDYLKNFQI